MKSIKYTTLTLLLTALGAPSAFSMEKEAPTSPSKTLGVLASTVLEQNKEDKRKDALTRIPVYSPGSGTWKAKQKGKFSPSSGKWRTVPQKVRPIPYARPSEEIDLRCYETLPEQLLPLQRQPEEPRMATSFHIQASRIVDVTGPGFPQATAQERVAAHDKFQREKQREDWRRRELEATRCARRWTTPRQEFEPLPEGDAHPIVALLLQRKKELKREIAEINARLADKK